MEHVTAGTCRPRSLPSKAMMDAPWCVVCVSFLRPNVVVTWRRHRAYENALNMYGKRGYGWTMHRICMECVWDMHGICLGHVWNMYGIRKEYSWDMYAMYIEYVWNLSVQCMEYARNM